jgi:LmbE family N-acetylglucosaminyl deacetylase
VIRWRRRPPETKLTDPCPGGNNRRSRRKVIASILLLLAIIAVSLLSANLTVSRLAALPAPFIDDLTDAESIMRLLVVSPHPDDETIAAGGLIQQVLQRNGEVRVVIVTNGDGSLTGTMAEFRRPPRATHYIQSGLNRQQESLSALARLGVSLSQVDFLGYPDRGIQGLWTDYWEDDEPYRSPFTRLTLSPYPLTRNPSMVYSGHSLLADLREILREFQPDTVVAPHYEDSHPDHWATGAFTALALAMERLEPAPRLLMYLVHRGDFPTPRGNLPFAPLLPPLRLVNDSVYWQKQTLTDEVVAAKGEAMEQYRSQLPLMGGFLRSFVRQNELFCELNYAVALRLVEEQSVTPVVTDWILPEGTELHPVLQDSVGDTLTQELGPGTDFVALYVGVTGDELWIAGELRGTASPLLEYRSFVRAADGGEVARARVLYPVRVFSRPREQAQGPFLLARYRLEELAYPHTVIASFEAAYPRGPVIDRIGWTVVGLEEAPVAIDE